MSIKWQKWYTTIDSYGKIYFPDGARDYLQLIEKSCRHRPESNWSYEIIGEKKEKLKKDEVVVELYGHSGEIIIPDRLDPDRSNYMLGVIDQQRASHYFRKGKYLLFCPYFALTALLPEIQSEMFYKRTSFFKGIIVVFDESHRIYIPTDFQKLVGIDYYKDKFDKKNLIIRTQRWKPLEEKSKPLFGYWLEIWNRKDLEK